MNTAITILLAFAAGIACTTPAWPVLWEMLKDDRVDRDA